MLNVLSNILNTLGILFLLSLLKSSWQSGAVLSTNRPSNSLVKMEPPMTDTKSLSRKELLELWKEQKKVWFRIRLSTVASIPIEPESPQAKSSQRSVKTFFVKDKAHDDDKENFGNKVRRPINVSRI
jgi:hypothetical protein